jgi:uncharacterized protein (DUF1800 family)
MSHENEKSNHDKEIHPEASPFEQGYQPESLPKITVPDLPDDAQGLSAEALAQVPTLTELVDEVQALEVSAEHADILAPASEMEDDQVTPEAVAVIQEAPVQADTWGEELQARMGKLNGDIHSLNVRLDRLEERNKTKV